MNELLNRYLANGLAEFEGLEISGTLPIQQDLINAVIAELLKEDLPTSVRLTSDTPGGAPGAGKTLYVDRKTVSDLMRKMLRRVELRATEGKITVDFELKR